MRYFVECTHTYESRLNTGIQRVVRNVVNQALEAKGRREIYPVVFADHAFHPLDQAIAHPYAAEKPENEDKAAAEPAAPPRDRLRPVKDYVRGIINALRHLFAAVLPYPPWIRWVYAPRTEWGMSRIFLSPLLLWRWLRQPPAVPEEGRAVVFRKGDVLLLLDSSWHLDIWPAALKAKEQGAVIVCVSYDMIPRSHPEFCDDHLVRVFNHWMKQAALNADAFVCISRTVALSLRTSVAEMAPERSPPAISWFWLGSELDGSSADPGFAAREELRLGCAQTTPAYVYVSTVEPRKNHGYALDAFEILWQRGVDANFIIVGRVGWRCEALLDRIRGHRELGRRLFMFNDLCDGELSYCYDHARGLIFTSITEGFGLPIVEALQRGLPVFASDIEVFREIGDNGVEFVSLDDPAALADAIERHVEAGARRLEFPVPWMSWRQSTSQLFERIEGCLAPSDDAILVP